ncbi:DNA polymerase III subunit gamma/tau [Candidatus Microgenomates bacterium]|nr:DNA polymerase III subunit gamma/tau [Candidatus Microgenomates bacterium]
MVFYLKYRPQKFAELDIKIARERLTNIFSSGKFPHAFLFCGPRGTGKTSAARIVAKVINCEKRKDFEPCNQCDSCKATTTGRHLDVFEIDAASNRGIDEIRDLRQKIKLSPSSGKYKIYIIDEVHMLTNEAFNALLKTLEEPPQHALFVLATTRVDKLPDTITSRCLRIDFKKATEEETVRSLKRIVKGEGLKVDDEVLKFITQESDGSFREAAKILEEASLLKKITLDGVKKILGRDKDFDQNSFLEWLAKKDAKKCLEWLIDAGEKGVDWRVLTEDILNQLHDLLMKKFGIKKQHSSIATQQLSIEELKELIELFSKAHQELRMAAIPSLPLELAVVEWCEGGCKNV